MKASTLLVACSLIAIMSACSEKKAEPVAAAETAAPAKPAVVYAYNPTYSSDFGPGNDEYARMVVQGSWKDWEDNKLDNMQAWLADSIMVVGSDNKTVTGRDNVIEQWKKARQMYSAVNVEIAAVTPIYSKDKGEDWVLVWATEIDTRTDGKMDTAHFMETWRINKQGKADLVLQYDRRTRKK